jgi:hypothetical protein
MAPFAARTRSRVVQVLVEVVDHLLVVQLRRVYQATKIIE